MIEQPPATVARTLPRTVSRHWRPQGFGAVKARSIPDPIVEPVWIGDRVLVHVERGAAVFIHDDGDPVDPSQPGVEAIAEELKGTIHAETLVLDGYLSHQPTMPSLPTRTVLPEGMSAGEMASQMLLGRQGHRKSLAAEAEAETAALTADTPLAFVAVDLLEIDGAELLGVPLLERKRLLESALDEGDVVRRTAYVRPPVDVWLSTWRALGFTQLVYKAANGRYTPGTANDGWATARIPQR